MCVYTKYTGYIAHTRTCVLRKLARMRPNGFSIHKLAFIHIVCVHKRRPAYHDLKKRYGILCHIHNMHIMPSFDLSNNMLAKNKHTAT